MARMRPAWKVALDCGVTTAEVLRWRYFARLDLVMAKGFLPSRVDAGEFLTAYVCCRLCGHRLRIEQGVYQWRHHRKHAREAEAAKEVECARAIHSSENRTTSSL